MNEKKPLPVALYIGIAVSIVFLVVGMTVWFEGPDRGLSNDQRTIIALSLVAGLLVVLFLVKYLEAVIQWIASRRALRELASHDRESQALDGGITRGNALAQLDALRIAVRARYGMRWRYRQPWLLLTGDNNAIVKLLPEFADQGWLLTADVVLLWCKTGANGEPDADWLKRLYKLRRRRPVDAIALVADGEAAWHARRPGALPYGVCLARIAEVLRWSAPVYVLDVAKADPVANGNSPVIGCDLPPQADAAAIKDALQVLRDRLAQRGVERLLHNQKDRYQGNLSAQLDQRSNVLADAVANLAGGQHRRIPVAGIVFAPYPLTDSKSTDMQASGELPLWQYLGDAARVRPGRRVGWHPLTVCSMLAIGAIAIWTAGMLLSGLQNSHEVHTAEQAIHDIQSAPNPAARLRALLALQQQIERYEYRTQHHAPLSTRFGLNRDPAVLEALWKPYAQASRRLLATPVQQDLEATLVDLAQSQTSSLDEQTGKWALSGHDQLKTYLMLANPQRAEPSFLTEQLVRHWSTEARITPGEQQDLAERLLTFYAQHLKANPSWRIESRPEVVTGARQTLLAVIGERNAQDTVYQGILTAFADNSGNKYPDKTLASLTAGTDPRGLMRATAIVPGVFTREAYEGYIAPAIEVAAKRTEIASDWVLTDGSPQSTQAPTQTASHSAEALQAALTEQYFADYADHWQGFMNSLQWAEARTLPAAIDQLKLMADARQSPVTALMRSLAYQGGAGARKDSLSDTLVAKAQDLLGKNAAASGQIKPDASGPLGAAFGPVLRLVAQTQAGRDVNGDLSLQRFLDRATALRLRLQQVSNSADADAQARQMAQALFQGKGSELADTQAYAQLMAASLGSQWAGMGETLFVRPITQATQTVLQPAQASLNDAWRQSIVIAWGRSFAGRYPFADSANDASLPELARFLRPQTGLIGAFLGTQLAGVLELQGDQWVPAASGGQALAFDPTFLKSINTLQRIAAHLLAQGEPQYRFELKPIPTPGLTDTVLTVDGQKLHYYNQRETWQAMTWPATNLQDLGTRLQWQSEKASTNKSYEFGGRWGLVRMLERAHVEPLDSATYQLTWRGIPDTKGLKAGAGEGAADGNGQATAGATDGDADSLVARAAKVPASAELTYPISYQLRTEVGQGPLEMLMLRGFVLPSRIFAGGEQPQIAAREMAGPRK
ncbi:ImcF-related family protein [Cupriavidus sp. TMH.W2]|uniref:ImcF-related family protein n=1 Tax=Cupriavidus sp. TMH.W2 TaxID=3434465 RepID=UPI003D779E21